MNRFLSTVLGLFLTLLVCPISKVSGLGLWAVSDSKVIVLEEIESIILAKPIVSEMVKESAWVHHPLSVLKQGRLTHRPGEEIEGKEPEEILAMEVAKDPWEERLKPIS